MFIALLFIKHRKGKCFW